MTSKSETMNDKSLSLASLISWVFAILFFAIGVVNTFWGNDPGYGIFVILLSGAFIPPLTALFTSITGFRIRWYLLVFLGLFIMWSALGVGELFDKIDLMLQSFRK